MRELQVKLNELNQELGYERRFIENIKNDIRNFSEEEKKEKLLGAQITLIDHKEKERQIIIKIDVLTKAQNVLLGIEL